jgi:hypothetical protein
MESHHKWGVGFLVAGIIMSVFPFLRVLGIISLIFGVLVFIFGGREKRIEEVIE